MPTKRETWMSLKTLWEDEDGADRDPADGDAPGGRRLHQLSPSIWPMCGQCRISSRSPRTRPPWRAPCGWETTQGRPARRAPDRRTSLETAGSAGSGQHGRAMLRSRLRRPMRLRR